MKRNYENNINSLIFLAELIRTDVQAKNLHPIDRIAVFDVISQLDSIVLRIRNIENILFGDDHAR